jgi:hypothetical protein
VDIFLLRKEKVTVIPNDLERSDVVIKDTNTLSVFCTYDALGPSTKFQTHRTYTTNGRDRDFVPSTTLHNDCCENLGTKLKLNIIKGM